jgi:hypothetical protein
VTSQFATRLLIIAAILCGLPLRAPAQELPLRVDIASINGTTVEYVLTNQGSKAATAWAVEFLKTETSGAKLRSGETNDVYITAAHPRLDPQLPRRFLESGTSQRLTRRLDGTPGATMVDFDIRVVAAIFEDGSAVGDPQIINDVFVSRQKQRDTYAALLAELRAARSKGARPEDLDELLVTVQANQDKYPSPGEASGLLQNLNNAKRKMQTGTSDSRTALENLERMMMLSHDAAATHSVRAK